MSFTEYKDRLEKLDRLIRLEMTGTPDKLASRINTSKRTVYRLISELKKMGCPVYFCKKQKSYCYKYEGKLKLKFESIEQKELNNIKGGGTARLLFNNNICHSGEFVIGE